MLEKWFIKHGYQLYKYNKKHTEFEAGYYYCPYIPLIQWNKLTSWFNAIGYLKFQRGSSWQQ